MTDFEKVIEFNDVFDTTKLNLNLNEINKSTSLNISENPTNEEIKNYLEFYIKNAKQGLALITEEFNELTEAVNDNDIIEVKDALCDLVYVIYGLLYRFNYTSELDLQKLFNEHNFQSDNLDIYSFCEKLNKERYIDYTKTILSELHEKYKDTEFIDEEEQNKFAFSLYIKQPYQQIKQVYNLFLDSFNDHFDTINYNDKFYEQFKNKNLNLETCKKLEIYIIALLIEVYSAGTYLFDFNKGFDIVHSSNMTKFCDNLKLALHTIHNYKFEYKHENGKYAETCYEEKILHNGKKIWIIRDVASRKVLKSADYKSVDIYDGWETEIWNSRYISDYYTNNFSNADENIMDPVYPNFNSIVNGII